MGGGGVGVDIDGCVVRRLVYAFIGEVGNGDVEAVGNGAAVVVCNEDGVHDIAGAGECIGSGAAGSPVIRIWWCAAADDGPKHIGTGAAGAAGGLEAREDHNTIYRYGERCGLAYGYLSSGGDAVVIGNSN